MSMSSTPAMRRLRMEPIVTAGRAGQDRVGRGQKQRRLHADMAGSRPHRRQPTAAEASASEPPPPTRPGRRDGSPPPPIQGTSGNGVPSPPRAPGCGAESAPINYISQGAPRPLKLLTSAPGQTKWTRTQRGGTIHHNARCPSLCIPSTAPTL